MYSTANLTDVELKDQGNRMFSARKYDDAINLYTKAIVSVFLASFSPHQPRELRNGLNDPFRIRLYFSHFHF